MKKLFWLLLLLAPSVLAQNPVSGGPIPQSTYTTPSVLSGSGSSVVVVPSSATPMFTTVSIGQPFTVTDFFMLLTQNVTSSTIAGSFKQGDEVVITLQQNGTGGWTFSWPTGFLNTPTLQLGASAYTAMTFQFCGTVGNAACPANDWQATDIGSSGTVPPGCSSPASAQLKCATFIDTTSVQNVGASAQAMNLYVAGGCDGVSACTGNFWGIQAPASLAASIQYTGNLTDGSGNSAFVTDGSQHMSTVQLPQYIAGAGAADVMTATFVPAFSAYAAGEEFDVLPNLANTLTNPTLNVNGLGAKTVTKCGTAVLLAGDYSTTAVAKFIYDGTRMQLQNPVSGCSTAGLFSGAYNCANVTPVTTAGGSVTTDQNTLACTIPAGTLNLVGKTLSIRYKGLYTTNAANLSTINLKVKICSVSGCASGNVLTLATITSAANAGGVTNFAMGYVGDATTQTAGAALAEESHGLYTVDIAATNVLPETVYSDTNTATITGTPSNIDSTAQNFLQISCAFSIASASNTCQGRQLIVESVQ